jgi:hypothetical protein
MWIYYTQAYHIGPYCIAVFKGNKWVYADSGGIAVTYENSFMFQNHRYTNACHIIKGLKDPVSYFRLN